MWKVISTTSNFNTMKSIRGALGEIDDLGVVGGAEVDIFIGCY